VQDFTRADFDTHAPTLLSGIGSLVNEADAKEHLHDSVIASGITIPQVNAPRLMSIFDEDLGYFVPYLMTGDKETKLADIDVAPTQMFQEYYAYANGKHFFIGIDADRLLQLYVSDGTSVGTKIIEAVVAIEEEPDEEIEKGPAIVNEPNRAAFIGKHIYSLTSVGNKVFFGVSPGKDDARLWVSDGSEAGTKVLGEVYLNGDLAKFGSNLIFTAHNDTSGTELWISDGTDSGTKMLKDINLDNSSFPNNYKVVKDKIFFTADDGTHGYELWISDGTTAGTNLVKDLSSAGDADPQKMVAVGSELFFTARDDAQSDKFWVSDSTEAGTVVIPDVQALMNNANNYINISDKLYTSIYEDNKIYQVDKDGATIVGTLPVEEIAESYLYNINEKIYAVVDLSDHQEVYNGHIQADGTIIFTKLDFTDQGFDIKNYGLDEYIENIGDTIYIEVFYENSEGAMQAALVKIKDNVMSVISFAGFL